MEVKAQTQEGICNVEVEGELTIYQANNFKKELEKLIKKAGSVVLNLTGVSEIDTSCFQLLMQAQIACRERDKAFRISSVSLAVFEVMEIFGMEYYFGDVGKPATN